MNIDHHVVQKMPIILIINIVKKNLHHKIKQQIMVLLMLLRRLLTVRLLTVRLLTVLLRLLLLRRLLLR
jgi:hypothetical protein